jgi:lipopolysaccharide/colanic/teichoic acid biosynthesis glycosyltransferase
MMNKPLYNIIKRGFDLLVALSLLVLTAPLMLAVAAGIRILMPGPALFRQKRPGLNGKIFLLYKFRTMKEAFNKDGNPLPDEQRLCRFGKFIRKTSLDELPLLYNVLRGDMSLIGPRPLLVQYLPLYSPEQARRHEVRPGITGWAQVNGRNAISWEEKFRLDVWYVDNYSLWLDLKIIFLSVRSILVREGISSTGHATMPFFEGSKSE